MAAISAKELELKCGFYMEMVQPGFSSVPKSRIEIISSNASLSKSPKSMVALHFSPQVLAARAVSICIREAGSRIVVAGQFLGSSSFQALSIYMST